MLKQSRVLLALSLALILALAFTSTALADDYSNHWSNTFVQDAISKGWISPDANGNVQPDALSTRGSYALIMWKSLGSPVPQSANPFTDVAEDSPYNYAVRALYEAGITTGMTATTFGPDVNLSREMACTMLVRAYNMTPFNATSYQQFADYAQISEYAHAAISAMVENRYIEGIGNNIFAPKQNLKNGEMLKIMLNVANGMTAQTTGQTSSTTGAIVSALQSQNAASMKLSLELSVDNSSEATIMVTVSDTTSTIKDVGYVACAKGDTFTNATSFKMVSNADNPEITVEKDGWYAVCATSNRGGFIYKTIQVTGLTPEDDAPLPTLAKGSPSGGKVTITVTLPDDDDIPAKKDIEDVYYISNVKEETTYTSIPSSATKITPSSGKKATFDVSKNGLYAVLILYTDGKKDAGISYQKIDITSISSTYTLTVNAATSGGGTVKIEGRSSTNVTCDANEQVTIVATPNSGYQFDGWFTTSNGSGTAVSTNASYTFRINDNTTLYAKFSTTVTPATYTVTFNSNGGTTVASITNVTSGTTITKPADPTKTDNTFDGWYKEAACTNAWNFNTDTVTSNITLFAKWAAAAVSVESVSLDKPSLTLTIGDNEDLTATVMPANANNKSVTWESSDTGVATVSSNGTVTAIGEGAAIITVTTADGNKTATCSVTVEEAPPTP